MKRANAFYLWRTKEANLLTQKCVDDIVLGTSALIRSINNVGIQCNTIPGLQEVFAADYPVCNPFEHVSTKYKQISFFKEEFGLIVSVHCLYRTI